MEKLDLQENITPTKVEEYEEASRLHSLCQDWAITHYWEAMLDLDKGNLSENEEKLYDIANVLWQFMNGRDPFKQLRKTQEGSLADIFKLRVAALILTNNKKKVSEFFSLPDDGKTLNTFIATRAREFFSQKTLKGLSTAQKANRVVDIISQNQEMKKEYCLIFMFVFPAWLEEKRRQDCTYPDYSFRGWVKMARAKKG